MASPLPELAPNGGFSRDALGAALAFFLPTFASNPTASAVTGAKSAASDVRRLLQPTLHIISFTADVSINCDS